MNASEPITIVIASKNRTADLLRALRSIEAQTTPPDAVLIIDQSPQPYDLSGFSRIRHIHDTSISGLTAARNRAIDELRTPRVLFLDDDVELPPTAIAALQANFDRHPNAIGFQCDDLEVHEVGRLTAFLDALFERRFFAKARIKRGGETELSSLLGYGMAYRTRVFDHERFDDKLTGYSFGEDWDFSKRASRYGRLLVAKGAEIHHFRSPVNRSGAQAMCRMRWVNYTYFVKKFGIDRSRTGRLEFAWWKVGEMYRWLRAGLGFPSDRKANGR